jgi:hypothetical protein
MLGMTSVPERLFRDRLQVFVFLTAGETLLRVRRAHAVRKSRGRLAAG